MSDAMAPGGPTVTWRVITQTPQMVRLPQGGYTEGTRITAQLPDGSTFYVDVPEAQYTPDNVKAALRAKAADMLDVAGSTS